MRYIIEYMYHVWRAWIKNYMRDTTHSYSKSEHYQNLLLTKQSYLVAHNPLLHQRKCSSNKSTCAHYLPILVHVDIDKFWEYGIEFFLINNKLLRRLVGQLTNQQNYLEFFRFAFLNYGMNYYLAEKISYILVCKFKCVSYFFTQHSSSQEDEYSL